MSGRGAHTKNIPSHPVVEYHPYTWEHYSQYNNNIFFKKEILNLYFQQGQLREIIAKLLNIEELIKKER